MSELYHKTQLELIDQLDKSKLSEAVRLMTAGVTPTRACLMMGLQLPAGVVERINVIYNSRFNYTKEGRGRKEMQKYLIARRDVQDPKGWSKRDEAINKAKLSYEKGLSEMATGRDGMFLLLYSIPRRYKDEERAKNWAQGKTVGNLITLQGQ